MSATTVGNTTTAESFPDSPGPPAHTCASRLTSTASMLALSITVPLVGYSTPDVDRYIADARSQAGVIGDDIGRLDTRLAALPPTLRAEVRSAVESAKAATDQATAALDAAASNTPERASATLADAQVALDAAVAQVRFVTDLAANADSEITGFLRGLQDHLNDMRGETLNVVG